MTCCLRALFEIGSRTSFVVGWKQPTLNPNPDGIFVGYGNGSKRTTSGRCVPKQALKDAFKRVLKTFSHHMKIAAMMLSIDEFRTSMLCHMCHNKLTVLTKKGPSRGVMVENRDVRSCMHPLWNRRSTSRTES